MRSASRILACAAVLVLLSGCSPDAPVQPGPSATAPATPAPDGRAVPELKPDGTAAENRDYFDHVVSEHLGAGGDMARDTVISLITGAGWQGTDIEVTEDATPLGNATDAISFSVRIGEECLIGQWNGEYTSAIMDVTATGRCLLGASQVIG